MKTKKYWENCVRFESSETPCPSKDNEYISAIKHWVTHKPGKVNYLSDEVEKAKKVCSECKDFLSWEDLRK